MSDLRDQLLSAQLGYHAPIYPDDLATQLLPPKRSLWPRVAATLIAGAVAVVVVIMLLNQSITVPQAQRKEKAPTKAPTPSLAVLPGLPQLAPPMVNDQPVFLPSLPSLPSLSEVIGGPDREKESPSEAPGSLESL
jgi:hypothetical protein